MPKHQKTLGVLLAAAVLAAGWALLWAVVWQGRPKAPPTTAGQAPDPNDPAVPRVTINGTTWLVELAITPEQRRRGLSFRMELPEGTGMLFVFDEPEILSFWMRDCYIPLDIAFVGPDRRVVQTYTMSVEPDRAGRARYESNLPAQWALEVPAGSLARAGVKVGQLVTFAGEMPQPH